MSTAMSKSSHDEEAAAVLHRHVAAHESAAVDVVSSRYAIGVTASERRSMLASVCRAYFPNSRSPKCRNTVPNNLPLGPRRNSRIHHISTRLPSGVGVAAIFQLLGSAYTLESVTVAVTEPGVDQSYRHRSQLTTGPALVPSVTSAHVSPSAWTVSLLTDTAGKMSARRSEKSRAAASTCSGGRVLSRTTCTVDISVLRQEVDHRSRDDFGLLHRQTMRRVGDDDDLGRGDRARHLGRMGLGHHVVVAEHHKRGRLHPGERRQVE